MPPIGMSSPSLTTSRQSASTAHFGWIANEKKRHEIKDIYERSENIPYKDLEQVKKGVCYTRTISDTGWGKFKGFFEKIFNWTGQFIQRRIINDPEKPLIFELKTFKSVEEAKLFEEKGLVQAEDVKLMSYSDLVRQSEAIEQDESVVEIPVQECLRDNHQVLVVKGKVDGKSVISVAKPIIKAIRAVGPQGNTPVDSELV